MSVVPKWVPHPAGKNKRGVDIQAGVARWVFLREGESRTSSIYLNRTGLTLYSSDTSVVTAHYGKSQQRGPWPVSVIPRKAGKATLTASDGTRSVRLDVRVQGQKRVTVAFRVVKSDSWTSNLTIAKARRLLDAANLIYRYQGNFLFVMSDFAPITIPKLPAVVDTDSISDWGDHRNPDADVTVFFVPENDALGVNWRDLIMMEDSQTKPWDEMTFSHEIGHYFSLPHPKPPLTENLMNQTAVGDRGRLKVFLTRDQIETICDSNNWKCKGFFDCVVRKVKSIFD